MSILAFILLIIGIIGLISPQAIRMTNRKQAGAALFIGIALVAIFIVP